MKKRLFSIVLAFILALSLMPVGMALEGSELIVNPECGTHSINAKGQHIFELTYPDDKTPQPRPFLNVKAPSMYSYSGNGVIGLCYSGPDEGKLYGIKPGKATFQFSARYIDARTEDYDAILYITVIPAAEYYATHKKPADATPSTDSAPGTNTSTDTNTNTDTSTGTDTNTSTGTNIDTGTNTSTGTNIDTGANTGTDTNTSAGANTDTGTNTNTGTNANTGTSPKPPVITSGTPISKITNSGAVKSKNINAQDYSVYYASTVKSYLYANNQGGLTRVEYVNGSIVVEDYDRSFNLLSSWSTQPELPIWGGFFAGEDYNFMVFGQNNPGESDSVEVFRIVQYTKDWQRVKSASLYGANTETPFRSGSLRCDEYGGYLYIRTCHRMYKSSDGKNHQANVMLALRQSDMTITDAYYDVMNSSYGYVSHSFNQFVIVDRDGNIVGIDHGDAYPRGVAFTRYYSNAGTGKFRGQGYSAWCSYSNLCPFAGAVGENTTGASVGGLAETSDCYIFSYNYDGLGGQGDRYPYFHYMDKASGKSWSVKINLAGSTTPVLAPTGLDGGYMLWNAKSGYNVSDTLYYLHYGADGTPEQYKTATAPLSDCAPIQFNGKTVWYTTNNSAPVFYTLDASGVNATDTAPAKTETPGTSAQQPGTATQTPGTSAQQPGAAVQTPGTSAQQPGTGAQIPGTSAQQPGTGTQQPAFTDVSPSHWAYSYVQEAAADGAVNGVGNGKFNPGGTLTVAQWSCILARAFYAEEVEAKTKTTWYNREIEVLQEHGILGYVNDFQLNASASRIQMAETVADLMKDKGVTVDAARVEAAKAEITDLDSIYPMHQNAVATCWALGIINGTGGGKFDGNGNMERAAAAAVYTRAKKALAGASSG